jgi:hypothetical protein
MSTNTNVFPLRPHQQAPSWRARLVVVASYWVAAIKFPSIGPDLLIDLVMIAGLLYWALVHHRKHWVPYFVRFHWLQLLMLMLFVGVGFAILGAFIQMLISILPLVGINALSNKYLLFIINTVMLLGLMVKFGLLFIMGCGVLVGKTPNVPALTDQARQWT